MYVLCCFLLCNSVLADFESAVTDSNVGSESQSGSVSVSSNSDSDSSVSDMMEGLLNDSKTLGEKVDTVVDSISSLGQSSATEGSSGELPAEVSPGGNTIYMVGGLDDGASAADPVLTDVVVTTGLAPVTPSDSTGVKAVLLSFIGNYDPPIVQFEYTTSNNYKQYVNEIQPDYVWICSFALIALFIYCLFKLGGGLLRG